MAKRRAKKSKAVRTILHEDASRPNIPSAEYQDALEEEVANPIRVAYERRNPDLDPQLVWRGKDVVDPADLLVAAPPLFIQEKVHPKALVDDLLRSSRSKEKASGDSATDQDGHQLDLFADFNGLSEDARSTEFYQHEGRWQNRMILGDSLHVMASLAEREGLRGQVQCIYIDPPYGIRFNSNFQWSTTSCDVKDGKMEHITRDPEMVKAFRDTWRDGIHSYLSYLRDRLLVARDLLTESGSVFVQIGDENVHRVRAVMDEVFGEENGGPLILVKKKGGQKGGKLEEVNDYLLWYYKNRTQGKYRQMFDTYEYESEIAASFSLVRRPNGTWSSIAQEGRREEVGNLYKLKPTLLEEKGYRLFKSENSTAGGTRKNQSLRFTFCGRLYDPGISKGSCWKHTAVAAKGELSGMERMACADRLYVGDKQIGFVRYYSDFGRQPISNWWDGFGGAPNQVYVVQTNERLVSRCLLLATDPGDLVLDPTCGSGTTAYVAEQWGRRWITVDSSRVALALARARIMGARYPWYLLADSPEGQKQVARVTGQPPSETTTSGNIRHGFVYKRVSHVTSADIANNGEIDVTWEKHEASLKPLRERLTDAVGDAWVRALREETKPDVELPAALQEWEVPREFPGDWPEEAQPLHEDFWRLRIARQKEIDESIARNAEFEYLYDQPYEDQSKVRVAGPFTVESLSPHREVALDEDDRPMLGAVGETEHADFAEIMLEHLKSAGVQQAQKQDKIEFSSLGPWPGRLVCAEGRYQEGGEDNSPQRRAGIFIGPEFGSVMRQDLVDATQEAADAGFDVLIACAFAYGPHAADVFELGGLPILKARMNADLHMSRELADTGKGNLFVIFGEPDIEIRKAEEDEVEGQIQVEIHGVDIFKPQTGKVVRDNRDGIACWMIDTDYNGQSFCVRHAYFLGQNDPYRALKTSLKAEINEQAWSALNSPISRPFPKPESGRIAVKVINHLGDEVMKVYRI